MRAPLCVHSNTRKVVLSKLLHPSLVYPPHAKSYCLLPPSPDATVPTTSTTEPTAITTTNNNIVHKLQKDIELISKVLYIQSPEDWYQVPKSHLRFVQGLSSATKKYPDVETLVREVIPEHPWSHEKFVSSKSFASQSFLQRIVRATFPEGTRMLWNVRSGHGIIGTSGSHLEIDILLPDLKLGFEYQDPHHYFHTAYGLATLEEYKGRDEIKRALAYQQGITLIHVPFWWDWNVDSLVATIKAKRSDLFQDFHTTLPPINEDPPEVIKQKYDFDIPELGIPMLALYSPQSQSFDPANWWLFEKYDGVRGVWHPKRRALYSRWGNVIQIANFVVDSLPSHFWLDGEVWFGRQSGTRYHAIKISKFAPHHTVVPWDDFCYMVFDSPNPELRNYRYTVRYQFLEDNISKENQLVSLAPYEICKSKDEIETKFFRVKANLGEGIILRNPNATYMHGYSHHLYKHKGHNDAEALVVSKKSASIFLCRVHPAQLTHNTEQQVDKTTKMMEVEMSIDTNSFIGEPSEIEPGKFVSFRYVLRSDSPVPLNSKVSSKFIKEVISLDTPKIYLVRDDVQSWDQVIHLKGKHSAQQIWKATSERKDYSTIANQKKYFDDYAKAKKFDPLIAENWYSRTIKDLNTGRPIIQRYGSIVQTLRTLYPEVTFAAEKFARISNNYWHDKDNRRKFFDQFALEKGFEPLVPSNWYTIPPSLVVNHSNAGRAILDHFKGSLTKALIDVYSFLDFEVEKFTNLPQFYWKDINNRRKFFVDYAHKNNFDPLVASNWYTVQGTDVVAVKGGSAVLGYHSNSLPKALMSLFPDIGLDSLLFKHQKAYWKSLDNRKKFFDTIAKSRGFDPLSVECWYSVTETDIQKAKGGSSVMNFYKKSLVGGLQDVYPTLHFELHKFHKKKRTKASTQSD